MFTSTKTERSVAQILWKEVKHILPIFVEVQRISALGGFLKAGNETDEEEQHDEVTPRHNVNAKAQTALRSKLYLN